MDRSCEWPLDNADSDEIERILQTSRTLAVVGLSQKSYKDSHAVSQYMQSQRYRIIPVNPNYEMILGERCFPNLAAIGEAIDIVNIFRRPDAVPSIVDEAIAISAKCVWMQEGIVHNAAAKARAAGLQVVMNKCILKEHQRRSR
ncbi:MAG: CoA-binding protein [Acidobacteria bacterium]|nr:CoA-binding protein [Acidobacteriota bacterium]MBI3655235.1 CoA-binding protein [Acidobacteriota bacterium]